MLQADYVFGVLNRFKKTKQISSHLFDLILKKLEILPAPFHDPSTPLFYFSRGITNSHKYFDMTQLRLSAILLGEADFFGKFKLLFKLYGKKNIVNRN